MSRSPSQCPRQRHCDHRSRSGNEASSPKSTAGPGGGGVPSTTTSAADPFGARLADRPGRAYDQATVVGHRQQVAVRRLARRRGGGRLDVHLEDQPREVPPVLPLRLREELPYVDVQIVSLDNTAFLLPTVFRSVRRRHGVLRALRETNRATTAGSVLVDGERIGDVAALGPEGVLAAVRERVAVAG